MPSAPEIKYSQLSKLQLLQKQGISIYNTPAYSRFCSAIENLKDGKGQQIFKVPVEKAKKEQFFRELFKVVWDSKNGSTLFTSEINEQTISALRQHINNPESYTTDYLLRELKNSLVDSVQRENDRSGKVELSKEDAARKLGDSGLEVKRGFAEIPADILKSEAKLKALEAKLREVEKTEHLTDRDRLFIVQATLVLSVARAGTSYSQLKEVIGFFAGMADPVEKDKTLSTFQWYINQAQKGLASFSDKLPFLVNETEAGGYARKVGDVNTYLINQYKRIISEQIGKALTKYQQLQAGVNQSDDNVKGYYGRAIARLKQAQVKNREGNIAEAAKLFSKAVEILERVPVYLQYAALESETRKMLGSADQSSDPTVKKHQFALQSELSKLKTWKERLFTWLASKAYAEVVKNIQSIAPKVQAGGNSISVVLLLSESQKIFVSVEGIFGKDNTFLVISKRAQRMLASGDMSSVKKDEALSVYRAALGYLKAAQAKLHTAEGFAAFLRSYGLPYSPRIEHALSSRASAEDTLDARLQTRLKDLVAWDRDRNGGKLGLEGLVGQLAAIRTARQLSAYNKPVKYYEAVELTQRISLLLSVADYQRARMAGVKIDKSTELNLVLSAAKKLASGEEITEEEGKKIENAGRVLDGVAGYHNFAKVLDDKTTVERMIYKATENDKPEIGRHVRSVFSQGFSQLPAIKSRLKELHDLAVKGKLNSKEAEQIKLDIQRRVQFMVYVARYQKLVGDSRNAYANERVKIAFWSIKVRKGGAGQEVIAAGDKNLRNLSEMKAFLSSGGSSGINYRYDSTSVHIPENLGGLSDSEYQKMLGNYFKPMNNFSKEVFESMAFKQGWTDFWKQVFIVAVSGGIMQGAPAALLRIGNVVGGAKFAAGMRTLNLAAYYLRQDAVFSKIGSVALYGFRGTVFTAASRPLEKAMFGKTHGTFINNALHNSLMFAGHANWLKSVGLAGKNPTVLQSLARLGIADPVFFASWGVLTDLAKGTPLGKIDFAGHLKSAYAFSLGMAAPGAVRAVYGKARGSGNGPEAPNDPSQSKDPGKTYPYQPKPGGFKVTPMKIEIKDEVKGNTQPTPSAGTPKAPEVVRKNPGELYGIWLRTKIDDALARGKQVFNHGNFIVIDGKNYDVLPKAAAAVARYVIYKKAEQMAPDIEAKKAAQAAARKAADDIIIDVEAPVPAIEDVNPASLYVTINGKRVEVKPRETVNIEGTPCNIKYGFMISIEGVPKGWKVFVNGKENNNIYYLFKHRDNVAIVKPDGTRIEFTADNKVTQLPNGVKVVNERTPYPFELPDVDGKRYSHLNNEVEGAEVQAHGTSNLKNLAGIAIDGKIDPTFEDNHVHQGWIKSGEGSVDGKTSAKRHGPFYVVLDEKAPSKGEVGRQHHKAYVVPDATCKELLIAAVRKAKEFGRITEKTAIAIEDKIHTFEDYAKINDKFTFKGVSSGAPVRAPMTPAEVREYVKGKTTDYSGAQNYGVFFSDSAGVLARRSGVTDVIVNFSLKEVNDSKGHYAGNSLIKFVCDQIKDFAVLRGYKENYISVYRDGPNFTIRINKSLSKAEAEMVMTQLRSHIARASTRDGGVLLDGANGQKMRHNFGNGGLKVNITGYSIDPGVSLNVVQLRLINRLFISRANKGITGLPELKQISPDSVSQLGKTPADRVAAEGNQGLGHRAIDAWKEYWGWLKETVAKETGIKDPKQLDDVARQIYVEPDSGLLNSKALQFVAQKIAERAKSSGTDVQVAFFDGNAFGAFRKGDGGYELTGDTMLDIIIQKAVVEAAKESFGKRGIAFARMGTGSEEFGVVGNVSKSTMASAISDFQASLNKPLIAKIKVKELMDSKRGKEYLKGQGLLLADGKLKNNTTLELEKELDVDVTKLARGEKGIKGLSVTGAFASVNPSLEKINDCIRMLDNFINAAKFANPNRSPVIFNVNETGTVTGVVSEGRTVGLSDAAIPGVRLELTVEVRNAMRSARRSEIKDGELRLYNAAGKIYRTFTIDTIDGMRLKEKVN